MILIPYQSTSVIKCAYTRLLVNYYMYVSLEILSRFYYNMVYFTDITMKLYFTCVSRYVYIHIHFIY